MIKKILFLLIENINYFFLRIINSVVIRFNENYFIYPIKFILPSLVYAKILDKVKLISKNNKIKKSYTSEGIILDHGITKSKLNNDWLIKSSDEEIVYFPRRLFWLIYELTKVKNSNYLKLKYYLDEFITCFSNSLNTHNFPPYILSECISNINLFNRAINKSWEIKESNQRDFILLANRLLVKHLEFRGPFSTCNHLINNFRALYLSSKIIEDHKKSLFYLTFWDQIKNKVFLPNGKIGDGSVHYQFLITRWLFEISIYAYEVKDSIILGQVYPYLSKNLEIVDILSRKNNIPFFGDLSPDCPIEWLYPILKYTRLKYPYKYIGNGSKGWDRIWNLE